MASTLVDLVKINANSTGPGAITLGDAVPGFRGIEVLTNGAVYSYSIQDGDAWEFGAGTYLSPTRQLIRTPTDSSDGGSPLNLRQNSQIAFVALAEDLDAVQLSNGAVEAAAQVAIDATRVSEDRALVEAASKAVVNGEAVYPNAYASVVPRGVSFLSNDGIGTGSGGIPGVYPGGVSGGPAGFSWQYTIGVDGKIASYQITSPGTSTTASVPTLSYPTGGVTAAIVPTASAGYRISEASGYWAVSLNGETLDLYSNVGGSPAPVLAPDDGQIKVLTSSGLQPLIDGATGGPLANGQWVKLPGIYKLLMGGTGSVVLDTRTRGGAVTLNAATYDPAATPDAYPYFDGAYEVRATLTGTATAEII